MSSLKVLEKRRFEDLFNMSSGYVLDFTDASFASFFKDTVKVQINDGCYAGNGGSKAKRLRAFWEMENDVMVGKVLEGMLELWRYQNEKGENYNTDLKYDDCRKTVARLLGKANTGEETVDDFLKKNFGEISSEGLDLDAEIAAIIELRIQEAKACLHAKAFLSAIFMCGSVLEGVLLNAATKNAHVFNQAKASPKNKEGKVKSFPEWSLASFIDVSHECGLLRLDVKKFSHGLRDFRNYIHPYEQRVSRFTPDTHTAEICFQVLRAALAGLKEKRSRC